MRIYRECMDGIPVNRLPEVGLPEDLPERIFSALTAAKVRRLRNELIATGAAFIAVMAFATTSISLLIAEVRTTSFVSYLRLLVSDSDIVLKNLNEYVLGAFEVLPVGLILTVLVSLLLLLGIVAFTQSLVRTRRHVSMTHGMHGRHVAV